MKKFFIIFSSIFTVFVVVLMTTLCFVDKNVSIALGAPIQINVYNRSTNTTKYVNGIYDAYVNTDSEYDEILENLNLITSETLMTWLLKEGNLNFQPEYGSEGYTSYSTDMKNTNIVVELIYNMSRDVVVLDNGNERVIPYVCLLIVIPVTTDFEEIFVYTSITSDSNEKENQYTSSVPFILKGNASEFIAFVESL